MGVVMAIQAYKEVQNLNGENSDIMYLMWDKRLQKTVRHSLEQGRYME
jgi:hypothetical protein